MTWLEQARVVLDRLEHEQLDAIGAAADIAAEAIAVDGVVHVFGTGHSRIPVEELFPRYGSYPGFHPIVELSMTFHTQVVGANGQRQAMFVERTPGLADVILSNFTLRSTDALVVFSSSGRNAVPIELALTCKQAGLGVIAVTSLAESRATPPTHASGTVLADHADVVVDLCTPLGDAAVSVEGYDEPIGPLSSLAYIAIANTLKVFVAERLAARGIRLPVITSAQLVGRERSQALFDAAYAEYARRAAAVLRTQP